MTREELNDLLELIDARIDDRKSSDIADSVRFDSLKNEFIVNWCDKEV